MELMQLIQEADMALIAMEQSRQTVELAKAALESAKTDADEAKARFDDVISRADEFGVPRMKVRKLAEERAAALMASGLISEPVNRPRPAKAPRASKRPKSEADFDSSHEPMSAEESTTRLDA